MAEETHTVGKQMSFAELFEEFQDVQIPIIQRDYAQGRIGHEELRSDFLSALKQALEKEGNEPIAPLDLDFVYGSIFDSNKPSKGKSFAPLDGQQRLTTLFLLHWYLAWKDDKVADFQGRFLQYDRSRFAYEVRPSSHDFFNRLARNVPTEPPTTVQSLSTLIEDKPWFFRSWRYDPTIDSALRMLDDIHRTFANSIGYYQRLIDPEHPRITFQLLELKYFGLSDDLYIKMNARGWPLTPFENFKARLEQHLDRWLHGETRLLHERTVAIGEYFSHQMDTTWADLFWKRRNLGTNLYDDEFMRLIKAVAMVSMDPDADTTENTLIELRSVKSPVSFARLVETGCLNEKMLRTCVSVLDYWDWEEQSGLSDGRAIFDDVTSRELPYAELVKFGAFSAFVRSHSLPPDRENLARWQRVIFNLVENSDIERPRDFVDVMKSLAQLEPHADRILEYLAEGSDVPAFNRQQVREERIKSTLILKETGWKEHIFKAEAHGYFEGQVEFLLKFSGVLDHWLASKNALLWSNAEDREAQAAFGHYREVAEVVFDGSGLRRFPDFKWERALLAIGDYTLAYGKNHSFLQDRSGEHRPTWKALLRGDMTDSINNKKRQLIKTILDEIDLDGGVDASLERVIEKRTVAQPWREMLVRDPELINYCWEKMFRHIGRGAVYLIRRKQTNSTHVELYSYYLYRVLLSQKESLSPFGLAYIDANSEDYIPFARLRWTEIPDNDDVVIDIRAANDRYRLELTAIDDEVHQFLIEKMETKFSLQRRDKDIFIEAPRDEIESDLREIVTMAREYQK